MKKRNVAKTVLGICGLLVCAAIIVGIMGAAVYEEEGARGFLLAAVALFFIVGLGLLLAGSIMLLVNASVDKGEERRYRCRK